MKELKSGILVEPKSYYKLLEWKDNNMDEFLNYCTDNDIPVSINDMTSTEYHDLLNFTKI